MIKSKPGKFVEHTLINLGSFLLILFSLSAEALGQPEWRPQWKWETTYDSLGHVVELVESDYDYEYWSLNHRNEYYYTDGLVSEEFTQYAVGDNWQDNNWITNSYDSTGLELSKYYQYWSTLDTQWADWSLRTKVWDQDRNLVEVIDESWFDEMQVLSSRYSYTYHEGNLTARVYEDYADGEWVPKNRWLYEYDALNQNIEEKQQEWKWGDWRDERRSLYFYDSEGYQVEQVMQDYAVLWSTTQRVLKM